jgi:hypothetical protein
MPPRDRYSFADWIALGLDAGTTLGDVPPTPQIMQLARGVLGMPPSNQ